MTERVAILGAGSFGTALAIAAAAAGTPVTLWARREDAAAAMRTTRRNEAYLPGGVLPEGVDVTADLGRALGTELAPLGEEGDHQAVLAMDAEGRVYSLDHTGDWYLGHDIDTALATLVTGTRPTRLTAG